MHPAYAPETERKYAAAFGAWCRYAIAHHCRPLPATGADVTAYLTELVCERRRSFQTAQQAAFAIRAMHRRGNYPEPDIGDALERLAKLARAWDRKDAARRHVIRIRLTDTELEQLQAEAHAQGVSLRRWLRMRAMGA